MVCVCLFFFRQIDRRRWNLCNPWLALDIYFIIYLQKRKTPEQFKLIWFANKCRDEADKCFALIDRMMEINYVPVVHMFSKKNIRNSEKTPKFDQRFASEMCWMSRSHIRIRARLHRAPNWHHNELHSQLTSARPPDDRYTDFIVDNFLDNRLVVFTFH